MSPMLGPIGQFDVPFIADNYSNFLDALYKYKEGKPVNSSCNT